MDMYTATEAAYKNGYEQGKKDAVVRARWKESKEEKLYCDWNMDGWYAIPVVCTNCGYDATEYQTGKTNYCPECGACMVWV